MELINSLTAHTFAKVSLLTVCLDVNKFDIACLWETSFNPENLNDDGNLQTPGYTIIRVDHPFNTKRVSVFVYFKNSLPLKLLDIKYLQECIKLELRIRDDVCNFIIIYRSPSQTHDDFETFIKNV